MGRGLQPGEVELSHEAPTLPEFNATAMAQLEGMGFPTVRCQKALLATGNDDPEAAMEWLFAHMDDSDIDEPIQPSSAGGRLPEPDPTQVDFLADMGFAIPQAKKALRETVSVFHKLSHCQLGIDLISIGRVVIQTVPSNGCSAILMILVKKLHLLQVVPSHPPQLSLCHYRALLMFLRVTNSLRSFRTRVHLSILGTTWLTFGKKELGCCIMMKRW